MSESPRFWLKPTRYAARWVYAEGVTSIDEVTLRDRALALIMSSACVCVVPDPLASGKALE